MITLSGSNYPSRTNFHGPKDIRAIELRLYVDKYKFYLRYPQLDLLDKNSKRLPIETKNKQKAKNRKFGIIKLLICNNEVCQAAQALTFSALAVFDFQRNQNRLSDTKGNKNISCTVMACGKRF